MEEVNIDIELFRKPLGGWFDKLSPFFGSDFGRDIYKFLKKRRGMGNIIYPQSDKTYRAFELTPPNEVKVVLVGLSPYHNKGKNFAPCADGLLFSNSLTKELSPSLKMFYDALDEEVGHKVERCPDLSYLAKQGVLLLNASLTTEQGKPTIHNEYGVWDAFNEFFYGNVLETFCGFPIVTMGREAKKLEKHLFPMCHVLKNVEHPAYALRQHREWNSDGMFRWVNTILKENNGDFCKIYWDKKEYDEMADEKLPWD